MASALALFLFASPALLWAAESRKGSDAGGAISEMSRPPGEEAAPNAPNPPYKDSSAQRKSAGEAQREVWGGEER